ncbi:endonuclease domain-containing 1 protein-like [Dendropsophus ebraccatus]|uniref:endonuclease domain-containing 1 protein-like n=1 Tax=Dendropsophus ebraccatus TaxID=150705 RepID=UPI003831B34B
MKLLLSISLFLAALIHIHAEVRNNFDNCKKYFYKENVPNGFQGIAKKHLFNPNDLPDGITDPNHLASPAYICQTYDGTSWFATLYDRGRRMPLYSAYTIYAVKDKDPSECKRPGAFQLEPQLVYREVDKNMKLTKDAKIVLGKYNKDKGIDQSKPKNQVPNLLKTSQAIDDDYVNTGYQRGHLSPCGHQTLSTEGHKATFTLTNVVPMEPNLNNKIWSQYEDEMIALTDKLKCTDTHVIAGIVPGNVPIKKDGLTVPTHIWNAYCCVDNNKKPIKSGAALVENVAGKQIQKFDNVVEFQKELQRLLGVIHDIKLFDGGCKAQ